jgi:ribose 5-phosphate isomerase B
MSNEMKIVIGCDHAAPDMKNDEKAELIKMGFEVTDVGTHSTDSCDYPDIAHALCEKITDGSHRLGILICGTGIGMSIAANKHVGIRAACCSEAFSAELTRRHNDANVLCFGARVIDLTKALELTRIFVTTEYEGLTGGRHKQRLDKIAAIEQNSFNK